MSTSPSSPLLPAALAALLPLGMRAALAVVERELVLAALTQARGSRRLAARMLNVTERTIYRHILAAERAGLSVPPPVAPTLARGNGGLFAGNAVV